MHSPGVRSESRVLDEKPLLGPAEHSVYRTIVGKLMVMAAERPDIQFCVKECARGVQSPPARDMQRAKRICRCLMGTRDWTLKLEPWKDVDSLQMMVDSDYATDKVDRRSTSAGVAQLGGCTIITCTAEHRNRQRCRRQKLRDMHSEAVHAKDSASVLWQKSLEVELKLALHSDSTAKKSQHAKMGLGRMKHVERRYSFVKDFLKRERLTLCKILGTENPADLGTKVLEVNTHRHLCSIIGLGPAKQSLEEIKRSPEEPAIHWKLWTAERVEKV